MKCLLPLLPCLLLAAAPQDDAKTELAKLEGTWATHYVEIDGKVHPEGAGRVRKLTYREP